MNGQEIQADLEKSIGMDSALKKLVELVHLPSWVADVIAILVIILIAYLLLKYGRVLIEKVERGKWKHIPKARLRTLNSLFYNVFRVVVCFFALASILGHFGISTTSIITAAGVGGIAIAFGAQSLISDVISGIFLLVNGGFDVGDWIVLGSGIEGEVVNIGLRRTILHDYSGAVNLVPNSKIQIISNLQKRPLHCDVEPEIPYTVPYEKAVELADQAVQKLLQKEKNLYVEKPHVVGIVNFGPLTYRFRIVATTKPGNQYHGGRMLRNYVKGELDQYNAFIALNPTEKGQA